MAVSSIGSRGLPLAAPGEHYESFCLVGERQRSDYRAVAWLYRAHETRARTAGRDLSQQTASERDDAFKVNFATHQ